MTSTANSNRTGSDVSVKLIRAAKKLRDEVDQLTFADPVTHVYNPLRYAWKAHQAYLALVKGCSPSVLFLGMNPGPWGMAQTGVPFGEIAAAKQWMGIETSVDVPPNQHPKRKIEGYLCERSEVSGRRLWGLFSDRFETPELFFADHFVANYCPLVFMEESGRNRTPDKLPASERQGLDVACDRHLSAVIKAINPDHVVGVGAYAEKCLIRVVDSMQVNTEVSRILHPSPASPAANKDWSGTVNKQLIDSGVWQE